MTTLKEDGSEAVASWTAKKKINIFEKKFIFIPVNADLHWSLCVVVNPGLIANNTNDATPPDEDHAWYVHDLLIVLVLPCASFSSKHLFAVYCFWILSECIRNKFTRGTFASGLTLNGNGRKKGVSMGQKNHLEKAWH